LEKSEGEKPDQVKTGKDVAGGKKTGNDQCTVDQVRGTLGKGQEKKARPKKKKKKTDREITSKYRGREIMKKKYNQLLPAKG